MHAISSASANATPAPWASRLGSEGVQVLESHDVLFREGEETTGFYEVLSGVLRSYKIFADGRRQIISFAFEGDIVGFGHGEDYRFDCDALGTTRVRAVPKASLLHIVRERPELAGKLLEAAGGEVANMQDHSILLCRKTAMERVAGFLLSLATRAPGKPLGTALPLPMIRADIADYLGLTIETVSRNMTKLRALRVIHLPSRGTFAVRNLSKLSEMAEGEETLH